jgi:hypothetical protein
MKKTTWGTAAVLMMLILETGGSSAHAQAPAPEGQDNKKKDEIAVTGEIVDMHCYVTRGAKGPDHAGCANACLSRGVAAGLRADDGRLYLLLGERPVSVKEQVAGRAGETVTVTGTVVEREGVRALRLAGPIPPKADAAGLH